MEELDIISLNDAAELLGLSPSTLRHQAQAKRFRAKLVGKTWVTTRAEVERYRRASLGQAGRPDAQAPADPILGELASVPWRESLGDQGELRILGRAGGIPIDDVDATAGAVRDAIAHGAWTVAEVLAALRADPRTRPFYLIAGGPNSILFVEIGRGDAPSSHRRLGS